MARDFFIRPDLQRLGVPERTIRVLEKVSLLIEALERITTTEGQITDINTATDALDEAIEDANLSITSLDTRLDALEADAPYVEVSGDAMTGALDVQAEVRCDSFRLDQAPTAEAIVVTHTFTISLNGANYKIPIVAA